ncbi:MAG TPA: hypothetical protein DDX39_08485, partial [Bacteroidales bacterium]|nr:hypothetical protein [Bacteroidales bacterium]
YVLSCTKNIFTSTKSIILWDILYPISFFGLAFGFSSKYGSILGNMLTTFMLWVTVILIRNLFFSVSSKK